MKVGFIFDTRFFEFNKDYYSVSLSENLLTERYLSVFDEMTFVGRYKEVDQSPKGKYVRVNGEKITFKGIRDENPIKRILHFHRDSKKIESAIADCDAVICRGWRGTSICKKMGKPYLTEVVNCAWDSYWYHGFSGKLVAPIMYVIRRITTKKTPFVIYVTNEFLQKRYPTIGKTTCISNVALLDYDDSIVKRRLAKIKALSDNKKIVIGTAAAVDVPFKGQRFVIRALARLKKQGITNFEYQIVGGGSNVKLKKLAEKLKVDDQVVFLGSIVHDKIFDWFDSLDIYAQPSLQEGLPRAMIEAMSRGLPCYGAKTGGIPELVDKRCVCRSNRIITSEFVRFFSAFNSDFAAEMAVKNYEESKKYAADVLKKRRYDFLVDFSHAANGEQNVSESFTKI